MRQGSFGSSQAFDHARHGAAEFACQLRLLRRAGQILLPLLSEFFALLSRQGGGQTVLVVILTRHLAGLALLRVGLSAAAVALLRLLVLRLRSASRLALMIFR